MVERHLHGVHSPLTGDPHPFYVLLETHGSNASHDEQKLTALLEARSHVHACSLQSGCVSAARCGRCMA